MRQLLFALSLLLLAFAGSFCNKSASATGEKSLRIVPFRDGDRWGFSDPGGKMIVPAQYESAYLMDDGYGRMYEGELSGLVSPEGKLLLEPKYQYISNYSNGRAVFRNAEGRAGYLDETGKEILEAAYEDAFDFRGDYSAVKKDGQYALIRPDGSVIKTLESLIPFDSDPLWMTVEGEVQNDPGYILVYQEGMYSTGLIDKAGNVVIPPTYGNLSSPVGSVIVAQPDSTNYGLIRVDGSPITAFEYAFMYRMSGNRYMVQKGEEQYGVIDEKGQAVIPTTYSSLSEGPGGAYIAYKNEKFGLIDKGGAPLVPFEYTSLYLEQNYLIATREDQKTGIISTTGEVILPFEYDYIQVLRTDRFLAGKNGKNGLIDDKGKVILPFEYDPAVNGGEGHEYASTIFRPIHCFVLTKAGKGILFNAEGKVLSDKSWMYCGYPDPFGLSLATDINGRDSYIGPDGTLYAKDAPLKKVTVSNVQALYEAIGNDVEITLENGLYDLSKVQGSSEFATVYDFAEYEMEDRTILIRDARNLHIKAQNAGKAELIVPHAYIPVLFLDNCFNTSLTGFSIGHQVQPGACEGAVIKSQNCTYLLIDNCDLYGSGTLGIEATNCAYLTLRNSVIRECTYGILDLVNCSVVRVEGCTMKDNRGDHMVKLKSTFDLKFDKVQFINNIAPKEYGPYEFFRVHDAYQPFMLVNCTFRDCSADYLATYPEAFTEEGTDRSGMTATKGLWLQKEPHFTPYTEE